MSEVIKLNATSPAAPSGAVNIHWQEGASTGVDAATGLPIKPVTGNVLVMTGDSGSGGLAGLVPAPAAGDAAAGKVLKADGTWYVPPSASGMANPMNSEGDIIYGGASGAATRLAAGTAGQVLQTNGSSAAPSWVTPSSGGGSSSGISLFPGVAGLAPTLAGIGLSTAYNQASTFSAVNSSAGLVLSDAACSGDHWEGLLGAYPSAPFTLTAVLAANASKSYQWASVVISESLSGKLISIGIFGNGGVYQGVYKYDSPSSYNSILSSTATQTAILGIRVIDDGTTLTIEFSLDGYVWTTAYSVAKSSSFLGASGFNYLGLALDPQNYATTMTVLAWNITYP